MPSRPGPKVLLIGKSGSGKTYSLRTLIACGIKPYIIFTEQGSEAIGDLPPDSYVMRYIPAAPLGFAHIIDRAKKVSQLSYESLTKLPPVMKEKYAQFIDVAVCCAKFVDDNGVEHGDVTEWGTDRALVIDNLSGLSRMAMQLMVGAKPTKAQNEYGVAMDQIEAIVYQWCNIRCWFVLISHVEREIDEISGGTENMVQTLGRKLAPKIPGMFSDVLLARKEGTTFTWSTAAMGYELKNRYWPLSDKLQPDFRTGYDEWIKRGGEPGK